MRSSPVLSWLLACALVLAQALVLMHGVAHAPGVGTGGAAAHEAGGAHAHAPGLKALFAGHDDDSLACQLFDSLSHTAPPAVLPAALPLALPAYLLPLWAGEALARWAALFDARGPPPPVR